MADVLRFSILMRSVLLALTLLLTLFSSIHANDLQSTNSESARKAILTKLAAEWVTHCIFTATDLNIPKHLDNGPKSIDELADLTNTRADLLYRTLDTLASNGIFTETNGKIFANNEISALLSPDHPHSLYETTLFYKEVISDNWRELSTTLVTGTPSFELVYGMPVFSYFKENPKAATRFNAAMKDKSKAVIDSVLKTYDFTNVHKLYDIGGGKGHFTYAVQAQYPKMTATIFELPAVITAAKATMPKTLDDRTVFVEGDFFDHVPSGADVYLLKSIIHDWEDHEAKEILDNCHAAMSNNGKLLLIELVLLPANTQDYAKSMDMLMMTVTGGRERTLEELKELLDSSGFEITQVIATDTEFSVIEARKKLDNAKKIG